MISAYVAADVHSVGVDLSAVSYIDSSGIAALVEGLQTARDSERRYRDLFERSPSPLLLQRNGLVVDANDAAARIFGVADRASMTGFNLLDATADAETRTGLADRMARLDRLQAGESLPVAELRMVSRGGRPITLQATGVRMDAPDGPAILSIYFDVTARVAAEAALRRSETMLSLLFATSPDCITLTDLATGRGLLVNDSFTRITGYSADEARGRTGLELGIWADPADRARLIEMIHAEGRVTEMPTVFRTKAGALVPMRVSAAPFAMDGRDYLTPEDMRAVLPSTLVHRVFFTPVYELRRAELADALVSQMLERVATP